MSKHPNPYNSVSRIAAAITQGVRERREKEQWQVEVKDDIARKAVFDYMEKLGKQAQELPFHYDGKPIMGIEVPYEVAEYLKENEKISPNSFDAYRRKNKMVPYSRWLKDMKPVSGVFGKRFQGMNKKTKLT